MYMEFVKTTILLRKDVHQRLAAKFGKRKFSQGINELLFKEFVEPKKKSMFGIDKGIKPFLREHNDRF